MNPTTPPPTPALPATRTPSVLCLLVNGFEEIETITPVDLLRRAGAHVVLAAVDPDTPNAGPLLRTGRCGITIQADALLQDVLHPRFDLLLLPGGPGVMTLRRDGRAARLAQEFVSDQRPVAAICAAPTLLADAGLLHGRRFTAHASVHAELPGVLASERVVEDGLLLTSRGAKAAEIATAIMA
jgi:4-methyl-5(b-hydroxyethyl)-thiazole monophosphate biosynthesis